MRHRVKGYQLNRTSTHRRALFKNLITSLIVNGSIQTTHTKAKAVQSQIEKLMTHAKAGTIHHRRQIDKFLNQRTVVNRLVDEIAPKTGSRSSGFTRIVKMVARRGDAAPVARLEFVDAVIATKEVKTEKAAPKKPDSKKEKSTTSAKPAPLKKPIIPGITQEKSLPAPKPQSVVKAGMIRQKSGDR